MANRKTLAILEILAALSRYFEICAEEESANEAETMNETPKTSTAEETATFVETPSTVAEEAETSEVPDTSFLPTPVPELYDVVQPAPTMSAEEYADWERQTDEVTTRGFFPEMGEFKDDLLSRGMNELAQRVTDEFTKRNIEQAQSLLDDRNRTLVRLDQTLAEENLQAAQEIFEIDVTRVGDRFEKVNKNKRVRVQLEALEGKTFGEIRNEFAKKVRDASERIEALEHTAERLEREQIEKAIAGNVDPKTAKRVRELVKLVEANSLLGNSGAVRSFLSRLGSQENRLATIAHFGSLPAYERFIAGASTIAARPVSKKSKSRQLLRA